MAVFGSRVGAIDCDEASSLKGDKFFPVAVPAHDPPAAPGVRSLGALRANAWHVDCGVLPKLWDGRGALRSRACWSCRSYWVAGVGHRQWPAQSSFLLFAQLACRQLGYDNDYGIASSSSCAQYGRVSVCGAAGSPVAAKNLNCTGGEMSRFLLKECDFQAADQVLQPRQ